VWSQLLAVLAPPRCVACRAPLPGAAAVLCGACRRALPWLHDACPRCALPRPCGAARGGACPAREAAFAAAWAPVAHDGPARELVLALKLHGAAPAAEVMAAQLAARIPRDVQADLVPVPAAASRRRARGVDHTALLTAALARRTGRRVLPALRWTGERRARSARDAAALAVAPVHGPVVLVDDVHTTGATLDACARALLAAGAPHVRAATYARTLRTT
jgi:predicted amidophosphoribosyltransferase